MRVIAHISDLHFGRTDPALLEALAADVAAANPDVVAISGDLTQRARTWQFEEARDFLARLPTPQIVVPGNHDVPLYNLVARITRPLHKYRSHIHADLEPYYADSEVAVLGLNTARSLTTKYGRVNRDQVARACDRLNQLPASVVRIVVTHHPFDLPENWSQTELVGRARMAMAGFAQCRVDLFLSGHLHVTHTVETRARYGIPGHCALVVQAGTAASVRTRGEANSWNLIRIQRPDITVEAIDWDPSAGRFITGAKQEFRQTESGWSRQCQ